MARQAQGVRLGQSEGRGAPLAGNVGLNWRDYEIDAVAKYLNRRFYDYPIPDGE